MMVEVRDWLTDEAIERAKALGCELHGFISLRKAAKDLDPNAKVELHEKLLHLLAEAEGRTKLAILRT